LISKNNTNHAKIKHEPPIGVIAPKILILVIAKVYREPEKITIPEMNK
jgi:hypothetical protein